MRLIKLAMLSMMAYLAFSCQSEKDIIDNPNH